MSNYTFKGKPIEELDQAELVQALEIALEKIETLRQSNLNLHKHFENISEMHNATRRY